MPFLATLKQQKDFNHGVLATIAKLDLTTRRVIRNFKFIYSEKKKKNCKFIKSNIILFKKVHPRYTRAGG